MDILGRFLGSQQTWRRGLRTVVENCVPGVGVAIVLSAVLFVDELHIQLAVIICGLLCIEGGVWKAARRVLPSERQYMPLRREVDEFIGLVRALNNAAVALQSSTSPEHEQDLEDIHRLMLQAVDRMRELAGKTDAEVDAVQRSKPVAAARPEARTASSAAGQGSTAPQV